MAFLEIENLSKRYHDLWAIRDFSLDIEAGEIFGLIGAAASGKSAVLRLIAGIETPNSGIVAINGGDATGFKPEKRAIVYVSRHPGEFPPRSTVSEIVAQNLKARKISKDEIRKTVEETLASFEISDLADRRTSELAAGERQLTALAAAVAQTPQILLLDDCFSNLDSAAKDKIRAILKNRATSSNSAIVLATQNQEDAFAFCDRVAILDKGRIAQIGTPIEIYQHPETSAVAAFFGRNNLIRAARLTSNKTALSEFQTIDGSHRLFVDNMEKSRLGAINQIVTLAIRPENLVITFGAAFPEDNLLKAEITEINRFGATTRIRLDAGGLQLEALVIRLIGLKIGDVCLVGLPPNRITVLKR